MTKQSHSLSLYAQLCEDLIAYIKKEKRPGERMPSEREICTKYHISRTTVRSAFGELESLGYVYRRPGQGTYVSSLWRQRQNLLDSYSFTQQMVQLGKEPENRILKFQMITAPHYLAERMGLLEGTKLYQMKRIRLANGTPMMVETTYLPEEIFPRMALEDLKQHSLYDFLQEEYGQVIRYADEEFTAGIVDAEEAHELEVAQGSPCLRLTRQTVNNKGQLIELTFSVARSDQFIYRVRYHQTEEGKGHEDV